MSKPSEFYVGVLDFFAVLLPGAIATAILAPRLGPLILGPLIEAPTSDAGRWAAFVVCAYFVGHLLFLVGSWLDPLYDRIRRKRVPYDNESAFGCATRIRDAMIDPHEQKALNTFQWSRSLLISKCPAAADTVHRLEADSKFFRSMLVICGIAAVALFVEGRLIGGAVALVGVLPCFARYYERRLKSTTQAYVHVITLYRSGQLAPATKTP